MPRPPSPKNLKNPLRILRALCSEYGEAAPLSQAKLAQLTGIAPDYVRSLETSRRVLNETQLDKIRYSIGASWDQKRQRWTPNDRPEEDFSHEWFLRYRTPWFEHPFHTDIEIHALCRRLQALLSAAEPSDYNQLFDRFYHFLETLREEFKVSGAREVFEKTRFELETLNDAQSGEVKFILRQFRHQDDDIVQPADRDRSGFLDLTPWARDKTTRLDRAAETARVKERESQQFVRGEEAHRAAEAHREREAQRSKKR